MGKKVFENALIYFVQGDQTRRIKIGKTNNPMEDRLRNLQTGSPDKLSVIGMTFEPYANEELMHNDFQDLRVHGEWFEESSRIYEYINGSCFKSIEGLYCVYFEVLAGHISFEEARSMSEQDLYNRALERSIEALDAKT
ncbi:MAG: GIY-YIG nuclease family protein [Cellvibrionaceae bacterium]